MKILINFILFWNVFSQGVNQPSSNPVNSTISIPVNNTISNPVNNTISNPINNTSLPFNGTQSEDCKILISWLPTVFNKTDCCKSTVNLIPGTEGVLKNITCDAEGRVTALNIGTPFWETVLTNTKLPPALGQLNRLEYFALTDSNITGLIPEEFGNWTNLLGFYVFNNSLIGNIPVSFKNFKKLTEIDLTENQFSGQIDNSVFSNWPNLKGFWVDDNRFSGQVPPALQNALSLQGLGLSSNNFSGQLPDLSGLKFLGVGGGETWLNLGIPLDNTCTLEKIGSDVCFSDNLKFPDICASDNINRRCGDFVFTVPIQIGIAAGADVDQLN
ncbi:hypothetical protein HDU92_002123 [Lobulomyces angularis]|nr:hypothetical protein HDU92_002123 [Lobulomyces angularis]